MPIENRMAVFFTECHGEAELALKARQRVPMRLGWDMYLGGLMSNVQQTVAGG